MGEAISHWKRSIFRFLILSRLFRSARLKAPHRMSDLQSLFAVLTAIYLVDCLLFLRRGSLLFRRLRTEWSLIHPGSVLANAQGGIRCVSPLPLFPASFLSTVSPCTFSPTGVLNWTPFCVDDAWRPIPALRWLAWSEVKHVEADRRYVIIDGKRFLTTRSSEEALQIAQQIGSIQATDEQARPRVIEEWIRSSLDTSGVERRLGETKEEVLRLAVYSQMLAFFLFLLSPLLIYRLGLERVGWWLLGAIYLQSSWLAFLLWQAHRRLYPSDSDDRFVRVCTALLAPLSAIRSPDHLGRNALQRFHPLAVAKMLCDTNRFRSIAGLVYRDLHHPILPDRPSREAAVLEALEWSTQQWRRSMTIFLRESGLRDDELLAPPLRNETVNLAYCPRCQEQFIALDTVCADCGDRKTVPWPAEANPQASVNHPAVRQL